MVKEYLLKFQNLQVEIQEIVMMTKEVLKNHLAKVEIITLSLNLKNQKAELSLQAQEIKTLLRADLVKVKEKDANF
jgi:hypothetical protein